MPRNGAKTWEGNFQTRGGFTHIRRCQERDSRMLTLGGEQQRGMAPLEWFRGSCRGAVDVDVLGPIR